MTVFRVLLLAATVTAVAANVDLPPLPDFQRLPPSCGSVVQVQPNDTCESIAAYANITVEQFKTLNPFSLCGVLPLLPGSPVCTGDTIAFCNHVYVVDKTDTCDTITDGVGSIINVDGTNDTTCSDVAKGNGIPVCVSPQPSLCAVDTLCGISLSQPLQQVLTVLTDYCTIAAECESGLRLTETEGKPALAISIGNATLAVLSAKDNSGHPELAQFVQNLKSSPNTLTITLTPGWFEDGSGLASSVFSVGQRRQHRKLTAYGTSYAPTGKMNIPRYRYYGRR